MMTDPLYRNGRVYNEATAIVLYSEATYADPDATADTEYPPNDTGSTGLDVCIAAQKRGFITQYNHCAGIDDTLQLLMTYPVMIGSNWYDSFDNPTSSGLINISPDASVRGGHEYEGFEIDVENKLVGFWNSWGATWGRGGQFFYSFDTLERLLGEQGDAIVPIV